jgi:hypothetical protein
MSTTPGPAEFSVIFIIFFFMMGFAVFGVLLTVLPFWKICTKAGFPGPLALLMLVPVANIVLLFYLAFAAWPALRQTGTSPPMTR